MQAIPLEKQRKKNHGQYFRYWFNNESKNKVKDNNRPSQPAAPKPPKSVSPANRAGDLEPIKTDTKAVVEVQNQPDLPAVIEPPQPPAIIADTPSQPVPMAMASQTNDLAAKYNDFDNETADVILSEDEITPVKEL